MFFKHKLLTTLLSALTLSLPALSQEAYEGQLRVERPGFSLSGGNLHVRMEIDYARLQLSSNASLTLTPLLQSGSRELTLPTILLNGSGQQKVYERRQVLGHGPATYAGSGPSVVLQADRRGPRRFRYTATIPFREWMSGCTLKLRTEECGCNGHPAGVFTDSITSGLLLPEVQAPGISKDVDARCLSWVNFLPVNASGSHLHLSAPVDSCITLGGLFSLARSYRPGSAEFNDLFDLIARLFPDNAEANINAAAVALSKRDTRKARAYLTRFSTLPEAFNNMGVLCMLEGNREKAELYLEMAVSGGVKRAGEVLEELHSGRVLH